MPSRAVQITLLVIVCIFAVAAAGLASLTAKRNQARVEVVAVYAELELALATLSVRMASMATALQQARDVSPALYSKLYADLIKSSTRTHERAMALISVCFCADASISSCLCATLSLMRTDSSA